MLCKQKLLLQPFTYLQALSGLGPLILLLAAISLTPTILFTKPQVNKYIAYMCVNININNYIFIYLYISTHMCTNLRIHTYTYVYVCVLTFIWLCVRPLTCNGPEGPMQVGLPLAQACVASFSKLREHVLLQEIYPYLRTGVESRSMHEYTALIGFY